MIGKSRHTTLLVNEVLAKISESDIAQRYLSINQVPCVINSPLREDSKPSFGIYSLDGNRIYWKDFATQDSGGILDLLQKMWNTSLEETLRRILSDYKDVHKSINCKKLAKSIHSKPLSLVRKSEIQVKTRNWKPWDIEYWESYGISLKWLKYAEVYPISHIFCKKDGNQYIFTADKYAYVYVEHKEGSTTYKVYQPFNTKGHKWSNKHDSSVISLWTKIPEKGDTLCLCSSLKDALCLWANTGIPAINPQGEGYGLSATALGELKRRYKNIYILYDNDKTGIEDGKKLAEKTGFTYIELPQFEGGKDISDLFKSLQDKEKFKNQILNLFN